MKGTLTKLDNQWMVRYDTFQNDHSYPLPAYNFLPLHPEYQTILPLDLDLEGKEVEFDWCVIVEHYTGKGIEYAKLIDKEQRISNEKINKLEFDAAQFMNWFIRHYSTATIEGMFGYVDSMEKPVSSEQILKHYREYLKQQNEE